jgi:hypothetical protein
MGFFQDIFGNQAAKDAAAAKTAGLTAGYNQATGLYDQGRNALTTNYANAVAPFTDVFNSSTAGANAYGDATGANGTAGQARAKSNFQTDPGYQFQLDQGLQAIDRGAAARGMNTSGNLLTAEQQYGTGLANQSYGQYVSRLQPYLGQQTSAAGGIAAVDTGLGNTLNTSYGNQGNLAYNTQTGIGNAQAAEDTARGAQNNSLFSGAINLGTKLLGYAMPTGGIGNLFMGGGSPSGYGA